MRAKFKCTNVEDLIADKYEEGKRVIGDDGQSVKVKLAEKVSFYPVYSSDPTSENYAWCKATPAGGAWMQIDNEAAFGHFKVDQEYYLDFFAAPAPAA